MSREQHKDLKIFVDCTNLVLKPSAVFQDDEGYKDATKAVANNKTDADSEPLNSNAFLRFEQPHDGTNYPHLNLSRKYTEHKGRVCYTNGYVGIFKLLSFAYDAYCLGYAAIKDYNEGTTKNSTKCLIEKICSWVGGFIGGLVGTLILPVVGTYIGGVAGANTGAALGNWFVGFIGYWD